MMPSSSSNTQSVIDCDELSAGYSGVAVVQAVSLGCKRGEIIAIIGPNGSGKSTLLKRIAGLLPDTGGRIRLAGEDVTHSSTEKLARQGLRFVPQTRDIFPSLTVRENLMVSMGADIAAIARILDVFPELKPMLNRVAGRLSGGERKMLAIARALVGQPLVALLLDEPTAGLSPQVASKIWPLIQQAAGTGIGIVVVEQNVDAVLQVADHAHVLVAGRLRLSGDSASLRLRSDLGDIFMGA
jgi:ABC-type branched-subunit amino acid transport system ATPase component